MIVVRNVFTAKPGCATKLAGMFKEAVATLPGRTFRILTDYIGDYNTVVFEYEAESLAEFETLMREYGTNAAFRDKLAGYTDLWITGRREILQLA